METKLKIGDKVAYSVQFLKSIGMSHSDIARARGVVASIRTFGDVSLATIDWDDPEIPARVIVPNLALVGLNTKFCAC